MKFVIVLACLLALAYADDRAAVATKEYSEVNPEDFKYSWETSNGINVDQAGQLKDPHTISVSGSYEYTAPDGTPVKVTYTADEEGYKPVIVHA